MRGQSNKLRASLHLVGGEIYSVTNINLLIDDMKQKYLYTF